MAQSMNTTTSGTNNIPLSSATTMNTSNNAMIVSSQTNPNPLNADNGAERTPGNLVDEFESGFLACVSPLLDPDMTNQDSEELRAGVQQTLQKFLDSAKALEAFFLQKRLLLSVQRPELLVKEDVAELRAELTRKETLIQKHYDKLHSWQEMLNNLQQGQQQSGPSQSQPTQQPPQPQQPPSSQQQQPSTPIRHQQPPAQPTMAQMHQAQIQQSPHHMTHQMQPSFPMQMHQHEGMMQGPLAKLERSTANIGMPDGWQ